MFILYNSISLYGQIKHTQKPQDMKHTEKQGLNLEQLISTIELLNDQIQDLRLKLRTETNPKLLSFRMRVVTHYRNIKINMLTSAMTKVDFDMINMREIIGLINKN